MSYERLHEELFTTCVPNNWQRVAPVTAEPSLPWHAELCHGSQGINAIVLAL